MNPIQWVINSILASNALLLAANVGDIQILIATALAPLYALLPPF